MTRVKPPQADDVTSIVIENGSTWTRVGYSGDVTPKHYIPTVYAKDADGKHYYGEEVDVPRPNTDIFSPMHDGCVQDWDAMSSFWKWIYSDKLFIEPNELPLVTVEPSWNSLANKQKALEVAFEDLQVPVFSLVKAPIATAYESARPTSLIIDIGSAVASVTPVIDGSLVPKTVFHSRFAGDFVNLHILTYLQTKNITITPSYLVRKKSVLDPGQPVSTPDLYEYPDIKPSFHAYQTSKVLHAFKETTSQVSNVPFTSASPFARIGRPFEFPDGFNMIFGPERLTTAEPLLKPTQFPLPQVNLPENSVGSAPGNTIMHGLGDLLYLSLSKLDITPEVLITLLNNIIICGGTSLISGLTDRIKEEILHMFPTYAPRFYIPEQESHRKNVVWTGASVLAGLGTFDQTWITKQEYDEFGAELAEKRFK
ncbi:actin [Sugiyamaella lignohabitans]|uniref:Actin n=1 Tax=Sugiyamaella lignohabitans TaxID=796027 RepID=A0A167C0M7_9ASCO|nr:actin [Sugiyamaella lignohabitans]ANB11069.1 actin [Sugiyamaella lignohabitans]